MNGTVSRRVFVGRTALGLGGAAVGGGAVAFSFADLGGQSVNSLGAVGEEIDRQLAEGIAKMKDGLGAGARQVATTVRLYASTIDNNQLRAALRKANRRTVVSSVHPNRSEVVQRARKLGHGPGADCAALARPRRATRRRSIVSVGRAWRRPCARWPTTLTGSPQARRPRKASGRPAGAHGCPASANTGSGGLRQLQRSQVGLRERGLVDGGGLRSSPPCSPSRPSVAACDAAIASFLVLFTAYGVCEAILALCRYYYGN